MKCLAIIFVKFPPSKNDHIYSIALDFLIMNNFIPDTSCLRELLFCRWVTNCFLKLVKGEGQNMKQLER